MDAGTINGIVTAILIIVFLGIVFWAYSRKRHRDFEEAARLPLDDEDQSGEHHERNG